MFDNLELWVLPITFIPGIALLIVSTTQRYLSVYNKLEFSVRSKSEDQHLSILKGFWQKDKAGYAVNKEYIIGQFTKMKLLKNAIICFYTAIVSLTFSSIFTVLIPGTNIAHKVGQVLIALNVIFVTLGAILIIYESRISDKFVRHKINDLLAKLED